MVNDVGKTVLQLAYEHKPKPERFIKAFQVLLFGVYNRNNVRRRNQESDSHASGENGLDFSGDDKMVMPGAWPN